MPDLLLELRSEEIPARMQRKAAEDLKKLVADALVDAGLTYEAARPYFTPRRLTLDIRGLTARSKDVREERKGPKVGAPENAIEGFLRAAGLTSIEEARIESDPKKGDFYVAVIEKPGRLAEEIIADIMPGIIRNFPWPKSMRWGKASAKPGALRWVRPLQSILCVFGPETEDTTVVDFEIDGIRSGNITYGHRFHAPEAITVKRFDDYVARLEAAYVVLDADRRKRIIHDDARNRAFAAGLEVVEDDALLDEVAGLVEWPVVLLGTFEEEFLEIPPEIIRLTIRTNQKCFVCRPAGAEDARLSNKFIIAANIEARDGGAEIAEGNGKVVRARLSDAWHFWKTDQADLPDLDRLEASAAKLGLDLEKPLDQRMARLDHLGVTFHARLGTQGERVKRIVALARELAPVVGADPEKAARAALLAKADLQTEAVGEFPELQGAMGRKYALLQGEDEAVATAIEEHYRPLGPSDAVPSEPVSIAVALADKLDMLAGFWAIDEKPTGSKDPYALRRAALGVIRILVENGVRLQLGDCLHLAAARVDDRPDSETLRLGLVADLLSFFHDRLKVYLRDKGARYDLIDAVLASGGQGTRPISPLEGEMSAEQTEGGGSASSSPQVSPPPPGPSGHPPRKGEGEIANDDLLLVVSRVAALGVFLDTEEGKNLLAGTRRAVNILAAEEKKGAALPDNVNTQLFQDETESALFSAVNQAESEAAQAIALQDFSGAMSALSTLREPIDAFFEGVLVNIDDEVLRANRLALLNRIRAATGQVADFSKIAGS